MFSPNIVGTSLCSILFPCKKQSQFHTKNHAKTCCELMIGADSLLPMGTCFLGDGFNFEYLSSIVGFLILLTSLTLRFNDLTFGLAQKCVQLGWQTKEQRVSWKCSRRFFPFGENKRSFSFAIHDSWRDSTR